MTRLALIALGVVIAAGALHIYMSQDEGDFLARYRESER